MVYRRRSALAAILGSAILFLCSPHPARAQERLAYVGWELLNRVEWQECLRILEVAGYVADIADKELCDERAVHAMAWITGPDHLRHEFFYGAAFNTHTFLPGRPHNGFITGELECIQCFLRTD